MDFFGVKITKILAFNFFGFLNSVYLIDISGEHVYSIFILHEEVKSVGILSLSFMVLR
jgi:hypothetical protein